MTTYVFKRLLLMIPTLFGITFLTYVIIRSAPGNPVALKADEQRGPQRNVLTAGDQGDYKKLLHLDKDPVTAYFYWVKDFFIPENNVSSKYKTFVFDVILDRLPNTLVLNLYAFIIFYALGIPLGIDSAVNTRTVRERVITVLLFLLYSLPSFWVGLNLIVWLGRGGELGRWLPMGITAFNQLLIAVVVFFIGAAIIRRMKSENSGALMEWGERGMRTAGWAGVAAIIAGMIAFVFLAVRNEMSISELARMIFMQQIPERLEGLPIKGLEPDNAQNYTYLGLLQKSAAYYLMPVFCMTYGGLASESRYMRVGLMSVMREDYIRTARAKGLPGYKVILRHALPNALTPIIVGLAGILPGMIGGSVIVETIFSVPGMGMLFFEAVSARDYNLIMAEAFMGAVLVLFGILVSDLILPLLDPRVSFESAE